MKSNSKNTGRSMATFNRLRAGEWTRRQFIRGAAGIAAGAGLGGLALSAAGKAKPAPKGLPKPNKSGVEHIVVVMMENRSFDHFLGWLPGAEGRQAGLTFLDNAGT